MTFNQTVANKPKNMIRKTEVYRKQKLNIKSQYNR